MLTIVGFFIFGPLGALGGLILGGFASVADSKKPDDTALDRAMRKVKDDGDARKAARRDKL